MRLATSEFIFMMKHSVMGVTIENQTVVGFPAIGMNR